jgi:universal stress protein E
LERATWLAEHLGATLELLICDYDQQLSGWRFLASEAMEGARLALLDMHKRRLEGLAAPLREKGLEVRTDTRWEHPLDHGVLRKVAELQPIITVKDTHYHGAVQRALFSNTDWNLIRRCAVPLLLVKPRQPAAVPRILAAVDPMHEFDKPAALDHAILALAKELVAALRGKLDVFHAFDPAPAIAGAAGSIASPIAVPVRELTEALERSHRSALSALLRDYPVDTDAVHLRQGVAAEQLLALSRKLPADIVVMGAVARSGVKRVFVGNTAERVLDRLPCDLLIVKPAGFAVPVN